MKIKLSQDQNTLEIDDVKYKAEKPYNGCRGCAFDDIDCANPNNTHWEKTGCSRHFKKDNEHIIWVKKETQYEN